MCNIVSRLQKLRAALAIAIELVSWSPVGKGEEEVEEVEERKVRERWWMSRWRWWKRMRKRR